MNKFLKQTITLTFCFFCFFHISFAQNFTIEGTINVKEGELNLIPGLFDSTYYSNNFGKIRTKIKNGKFFFKVNSKHQVGARISYKIDSTHTYFSGMFFPKKGNQKININIDSIDVTPDIAGAKENDLFIKTYKTSITIPTDRLHDKFFNDVDELLQKYEGNIPDSLDLILRERRRSIFRYSDTLLKEFIMQYPNSYVGLWQLLEQFSGFGYQDIYQESFNQLSSDIKKAPIASKLLEQLKIGKTIAINEVFPILSLKNKELQKVEITFSSENHTYTLVDFWFSNCVPCIKEFPELKKLFAQYRSKGFEIIGVSVDNTAKIPNWLNAIEKHKIPWYNYLDENGNNSTNLSINMFPANFLLDHTGKIIMKNIAPLALEAFLKENLKD